METFDGVEAFLRDRFGAAASPIDVVWYCCGSSRTVFCEELRKRLQELPVLIARVGAEEFGDPNSVTDELLEKLSALRGPDMASAFSEAERRGRLMLLLVSRRPLGIPQVSSPMTLPDWFPVIPGQTAHVCVQDVTHRVDVALDSGALRVGDLRALLLRAERALVVRMSAAHEESRVSGDKIWPMIKREGDAGGYREFLREAEVALNQVIDPATFRPEARQGNRVVTRLLDAWRVSTPDRCVTLAKALERALAMEVDVQYGGSPSLMAILLRPASPKLSELASGEKLCLELILVIVAIFQLSNAASHADQYGRVPAILLEALGASLLSVGGACVQEIGRHQS